MITALFISGVLPAQQDTIKIGLLIQDKSPVPVVQAAQMAVNRANLKGNRFFSIEVRSMEGPWGTGASKSAELVFGQNVWAVLASVDGRNSHLAEQVSAKTQVVFMSAWSGDPTLSQAFIPWYYCLLPNYTQQAEFLVDDIYNNGYSGKTGILAAGDYDSQLAASNFRKILGQKGKPVPRILSENESEAIKPADIGTVVVFSQPRQAIDIILKIRNENPGVRIISSLSFSGAKEPSKEEIKKLEGTEFISPEFFFTESGRLFSREFSGKYGYLPGPAAAYAFDGMNVLIEAALKAKNRNDLRYAITPILHEGITGIIQFDEKGNRKGKPGLMKAVNGRFVKVEN